MSIVYKGPAKPLNYIADTLHCLDNGRDKSCMHKGKNVGVCVCVCVCARKSAFAPGVTPGAIILASALCLTPDLLERYSVRVLNMSRPLTDRWGQKKRVGLRTSLTEIYE